MGHDVNIIENFLSKSYNLSNIKEFTLHKYFENAMVKAT